MPGAGAVSWLTWYTYFAKPDSSGPALDANHTSLWLERNATRALAATRPTVLDIQKTTWNAAAMAENVRRRRAVPPQPEVSVLGAEWKRDLELVASRVNGSAVSGIFLGDEIVCRGVPLSNWSSVASALRATLGPSDVFIWATECRGIHFIPGVGRGLKWVPRAIDVIAVDIYAKDAPADEAQLARAYYEEWLLPSLLPHQRVALVPGTFGDPEASRDEQDVQLAAKLRGYANWSEHEPRIVGVASWHWDNLLAPAFPLKYQLGGCAFPRLLGEAAAWRGRIAHRIAGRQGRA